MRIRTSITLSAVAGLGLVASALALPASAQPPGAAAGAASRPPSAPQVVVSGLNNPRQLSYAHGSLYVAEAGRGGDECVGSGEDRFCIGETSSVALVRHPDRTTNSDDPHRVVEGLISGAGPDGSFAVGADGVSARGGNIYAIETLAPPDLFPPGIPKEQAGKLLRADHRGRLTVAGDVSGLALTLDLDGDGSKESNPYAVLSLSHDTQLVADAAANAVFEVTHKHGAHGGDSVRVWKFFPDHDGHQSVPTSLAEDAEGNIYVGELNGEAPGTARVYQLTRSGQVKRYWNGFTTVTGVAVDRDHNVYVSQLFANFDPATFTGGQVTRVAANGARRSVDVPFPAGIAVDHKHNVYVSAYSVATSDGFGPPGTSGQVWRLQL